MRGIWWRRKSDGALLLQVIPDLPNPAECKADRQRVSDFDNHQQHQSHRYLPLEPMSLGCPSEGYRSVFHMAALVNRAGAGRQQKRTPVHLLSPFCGLFATAADFFALARHHLWTFPNNRVDTTNAAGWRKPVWRTGGTQKAFPPHLPRKRTSGSDVKGIIVGGHDRQPRAV